jgi:hypothetical protein
MRCAGSALRRRVLQSDKSLDPEPSCSVCPKENQAPAPRGASAMVCATSSRARVTRVAPAIQFQRFIFVVRSTLAAIWGISLIR